MKPVSHGIIGELNERSRTVFSEIVSSYLEKGEPVGSRTLSRRLVDPLSPATIRNVMLQVGSLTEDERENIETQCSAVGMTVNDALEEATSALSGLSRCAGLVVAPKDDRALKHIEFVSLGDGRALVVMVAEDGFVENRIIEMPLGTPPSALVQAANYLNARLAGRTIDEARQTVETEIAEQRAQLDALTSKLVQAGLATWSGDGDAGSLIIKGHARLLDDVSAVADLERVRTLFDALDTRDTLARLLDVTKTAGGVQIFIGAENELFNVAGCAMVAAPFVGSRGDIVGAIGVIGPARINYARIIPIVDYTAKVVSRLVG